MYYTQGIRDCAVVSIANYTGKSYEQVIDAGKMIYPDFDVKVRRRGTNHNEVTLILAFLTKRAWHMSSPRRGQEKLDGLLSWHMPNRREGHMTACINGHVYDTDGKTYPIDEYRRIYNYNLRMVWK